MLIDQEGGRVSRLPGPGWRTPPAPPVLARLYDKSPALAERAFFLSYRLIGHDLKQIGINVNCAPMLDIPIKGAATVVTDRAYGNNPAQVSHLGKAVCTALKEAGVAPVLKHAPGHGRALVDSHHLVPHIKADLDTLKQVDFAPFKALNSESMLMTAHIIYEAIDQKHPGTVSPTVVKTIIRDEIGFDGLIMSDDLNMHALSGSMQERVQACLTAGCDVALQCSGQIDDIKSASLAVSALAGKAMERARAAEAVAFAPAKNFDAPAALEELTGILT